MSIKQLYERTYQFIKQLNAMSPDPNIELPQDIQFIDSFKCLLCNTELLYAPMETLKEAEIGACSCNNTYCARALNGVRAGNQTITLPIRDLVMTFPNHGWSIMMPCHGEKASWGATPFVIEGSSPVSKIVAASNSTIFKWLIKLEDIPKFFYSRDINIIIDNLERMMPFA